VALGGIPKGAVKGSDSSASTGVLNHMDLAVELQRIYDREINVEIEWFWDCGIEVRLGDKINGFLAEERLKSTSEMLPWLQEAIARFLTVSTYASRLDAPVRQRGANRIFRPPRVGATVICPHCGSRMPGLSR
jgi:hypothetical protein